jgi:soluble lytic murein transglycosylase-like protein
MLEPLINEICEKYEVEVNLVKAIIRVESVYNPKAVSKDKPPCRGLMQLSGPTAKKYGVCDVFDPAQNIEGGVKYLSFLKKLFKNNERKTIAAYNTGEDNVIKLGIQPKVNKYVNLVLTFKKKYDNRT